VIIDYSLDMLESVTKFLDSLQDNEEAKIIKNEIDEIIQTWENN
jgi:hypothetical protein